MCQCIACENLGDPNEFKEHARVGLAHCKKDDFIGRFRNATVERECRKFVQVDPDRETARREWDEKRLKSLFQM